MGNKSSLFFLVIGFSLCHRAISDPTLPDSIQELHCAIKNRDARHVSFVLFDEDLSVYPQIMTFPLDWYAANARDIDRILRKRNSEGESAITLLRDNPNVRVARVINYALAVASVHALTAGENEKSTTD